MSQKIESQTEQKLRGGYYTPQAITDFICKWCIQDNTKTILEPSCGDGNFIESAIHRYRRLGFTNQEIKNKIVGIELIKEEAIKAQKRVEDIGISSEIIHNKDFFYYANKNSDKRFDAIIGNPPFIRYQNFPEEHRILAINMMQKLGLKPNKLTNIWVPFLVISASLLKEKGKMAMVLPAELFQVKYAEETRVFLANYFERITIVTFKKLVFENIQQEIVILLCEKHVRQNQGIRVIECENLNGLNTIDFNEINESKVLTIDHSKEKWTKYFLEENEINLLRKLNHDDRIISCGDIMDVNVGLVTGRNDFFMLNEADVNKWKLQEYIIPVIGKSNQLKGIILNDNDFYQNSENQNAIYLFMPPNEDFNDLPTVCQKYIKFGEQNNFHSGYKTRIRKHWYITPSLWVPDAFALRQVGDYPKLIINGTHASSTDTIHRVRFKTNFDQNILVISFLNSLSFAFSEITGRSYGGGVLTFEPTEIQKIKMPVLVNLNINFDQIDSLIRERRITEALDIIDQELLINIHGFTQEEVGILRNIWIKLSRRRNNRK